MKRFLILAALFLIGSLANAQVRIACGQNVPYTDSNGNVWQADTDYNIGAPSINWARTFSTTHAITGTADPSLYQHERWSSNDTPPLTYTIPVPAGGYTLNLLFSEDFATAAGQRTFNVLVNGTQLLTNFDIFATAGGEFIANTQSFNVISTGNIVIQFTHGTANNPEINAIDIEPPATPVIDSLTFNVSLMNCTVCSPASFIGDYVALPSASIYQGATFMLAVQNPSGPNTPICSGTLNASAAASCMGGVNVAPASLTFIITVLNPNGVQMFTPFAFAVQSFILQAAPTGNANVLIGFDSTTSKPRAGLTWTQ
jgi:Malectin domain